jgi:predicted dehydrogenase
MNIGIIGNRGHLDYVLEGLKRMPHLRLAAVSSGTDEDDPAALLTVCQKAGHFPNVFQDYHQVLDRSKIELVCILGPFELHTPMCLEAFEKGLHVFCEKPASITLAELSELEAGFHSNPGVHFSTMMGIRYAPAFYTAWRLVRSGAIGQVRLVTAQKSYRLGVRPGYYFQRETYGGTIPWVGIHAIDWVDWFCQVPFLSVRASQSRIGNHGYGSLEVSAQCFFRLEDEILAAVSLDYLRPAKAPTHGDDRIRAAGTGGVVEVRGGKVFLINDDQEGEQEIAASCERQVFGDFVRQIEQGIEGLISPEEIFRVTRASLLAQKSADEQCEIHF